ncbi:Hypp6205 [Branchiostoma lanceolatum]|uniref:Hypp6205 protein n=1 Tax=Branchiostoma lanceolatum TaxID=7740 RepID=A0A8J9W6G5_BRALA|nr:Hypp6205 [Branchiostoma lanceolatum]
MDDLLQVIQQSYTPQPRVAEIDQQQMYDVKEWLDTELLNMEHHNFPHTFVIERQDGEITMFYKMWSSGKEWLKANLKAIQNLSCASRMPTCGSHEDIDQFFSRIATEVQMRNAITVDELVDAISDGFPKTEVKEVKAMLDVKEFLGNVSNDPAQHSCPHAFRFTKDRDSKLVFQYKDFASDENWKSPRNDEVRLVDRLPKPTPRPKLVVPRLERLQLDQFQSGFLKDPSKTLQQQGLVKQLHGSEEDPRATRQESVLPTAFDNTLSNGSNGDIPTVYGIHDDQKKRQDDQKKRQDDQKKRQDDQKKRQDDQPYLGHK